MEFPYKKLRSVLLISLTTMVLMSCLGSASAAITNTIDANSPGSVVNQTNVVNCNGQNTITNSSNTIIQQNNITNDDLYNTLTNGNNNSITQNTIDISSVQGNMSIGDNNQVVQGNIHHSSVQGSMSEGDNNQIVQGNIHHSTVHGTVLNGDNNQINQGEDTYGVTNSTIKSTVLNGGNNQINQTNIVDSNINILSCNSKNTVITINNLVGCIGVVIMKVATDTTLDLSDMQDTYFVAYVFGKYTKVYKSKIKKQFYKPI